MSGFNPFGVMVPVELRARILNQGWFVTEEDLEELQRVPGARLRPVLVRCQCGRFMAPLQDVKHFIALVEAGGEFVRDVSLRSDEWPEFLDHRA